jgi:hypothetical protein
MAPLLSLRKGVNAGYIDIERRRRREALHASLKIREARRFPARHASATKRIISHGVSAQRAETIAQFLREERWLFERGEMATPIELVPVNEPGEETRPAGPMKPSHGCQAISR